MQENRLSLVRRFPALASRDFTIFLVGQFLSVIGTWMQNTAQPYLAYRISGRPFDLGLIGFASTFPTLLLALPAGVLVERWDKRKTAIVFQAVMSLQAFSLSILTFSGRIQIWHITVLALLFGMAAACRAEPGNLRCDIWRDQAEAGRFVLDELYADDAAVAAHRETPHYTSYVARTGDLAERTALVLDPVEVA